MNDQSSNDRVVVGIDGSEMSREALRWALEQARRTGSEVTALMSWELPHSVWIYLNPTSTEETYEREAEEVMDRVLKEVAGEYRDVTVHKVMASQPAGPSLVAAAEGASLLVVGSHHRGGHLGSAASYCVHHAPCPVLVFRGAPTES